MGKSRLAIYLAQKIGGEIVNADSRQVYRYMDIGTAKPSPEELALVPHHLFDIINPDADFSLAEYQKLAYKTIRDIHERGKIPFLVGGSGQYIWAVLEGWEIPRVPPDPELRKQLEKSAGEDGIEGLYQRLQEVDPEAARKIDKRNVRRVIRALEVSLVANIPFSALRRKRPPGYHLLVIGLTAERSELYRRIDSRVDRMIREGLVDEVLNLQKMGYKMSLPALSSIGYQQIGKMLGGEINLAEAVRQIKTGTHRFARHQYAWFRLADRRIVWFDIMNDPGPEILQLTANTFNSI